MKDIRKARSNSALALDARRALAAEIAKHVHARRFCEASTPDCDSFTDELHEPIETGPRIPARDNIVSLAGCIAVCRHCHNFLHRNRDYAIARGLIFPRGSK